MSAIPSAPVRLLSWPQLVAAQFLLTVKSRRWMELIGGAIALQAVALLLAVLVDRRNAADPFITAAWDGYRTGAFQRIDVETWRTGLVFLAAMWAAFLWRDEGPSQRRYHWSLPAERSSHDLARVAAGAIWVVILVLLAVTVISVWFPRGGSISAPRFSMILLAAYGLGSVAALTTERPLVWMFGAVALAATAVLIQDVTNVGDDFEFFYESRWAPLFWLIVAILGVADVTQRRAGNRKLAFHRL